MNRRDAIKRTSLLLGYAVSASTVAAVMSGCKADPEVVAGGLDNWIPESMTKDEGLIIAHVAETVLPKTDSAGAIEAGVHSRHFNFFVSRVRGNMHIVLCLSPVGDSFKRRLRMFPSLVSCCTINWFNPWPEDALLSVARRFIQNVDAIKGDADMQESVSQACVFIHQSIDEEAERFYNTLKRRVYITPKSYLDLIASYEMYLFEKRSELRNR